VVSWGVSGSWFGREFLFTIITSPTARTNWCGITTPRAPPNIVKNDEPIFIFQPSILFSARFTSSIWPKKSQLNNLQK